MKGCRVARERLLRARDGSLPLEDEFRLESHLAACSECRAFAAQAEALEDALARLAEPPDERLDLEQQVLAIRSRIGALGEEERRRSLASRARSRRLALGAAGLVLAAGAYVVVREGRATVRELEQRAALVQTPANAPAGEVRSGAPDQDAAAQANASVVADPPVVASRLEAARAEVREHLVSALETAPPAAARGGARSFAERFDALAASPTLAGWPILRIVEGLLDDGDARVAGAAARLLGARGDRLSLAALERRAFEGRPAELRVRAEVLAALVDLGDMATLALGRALADVELGDLARGRLGDLAPREAARALGTALTLLPPGAADETRARTLLTDLAALGEPGVPALLDAGRGASVEDELVLAALESTPGASLALANQLAAASVEDGFLLAALARLHSSEGLAWLEERFRDRRDRTRALAGLSGYGAVAARSLFALWMETRGRAELQEPLLAALGGEAARTRELALSVLESRDALAARELIELCASTGRVEVAGALVLLAASELVSPEDRQLALAATGDLGSGAEVEELLGLFRRLDRRERRLAAACLLALRQLGGELTAERALATASPSLRARVLELLGQRDPDSISLVRLARALEPALDAATDSHPRTSP